MDFVLDVDGVMTTGQFFYTSEGKVMKVFGADDNDGLSLLKNHVEIRFVTGDKKGFDITVVFWEPSCQNSRAGRRGVNWDPDLLICE